MKHSARALAGALSAAVLCSAGVASAEPVALTAAEMDNATAGLRPDVAARLAAVRNRLEQLRARLTAKWRRPAHTVVQSGGSSQSSNVRIVHNVSRVSVNSAD